MDGLAKSQTRIFMEQARITQAKNAAHGGGATPRFRTCRPALQLQIVN
jgi:hypothetical protein